MIAYGVYMMTYVLDRRFDLGIKGQGQTYINPAVWILMQIPLITFFDGDINI